MKDAKKTFVKAFSLIFILSLISKVLGFVREMLFASCYGTSTDMDAYIVACMIATIPGVILQTCIGIVFIPVYTSYLALNKVESARRLTNIMFCLLGAFTTIIAVIEFFFASDLISILAPGFSIESQALSSNLARIMMPILFFYALLGLVNAVQQAHDRFFYPALTGIVFNLCIITIVYFYAKIYGVYAAAVSLTFASAVQLFIQWPGISRCGHCFKIDFSLSFPGIRKIGKLIIPVLASTSFYNSNFFVDRFLASTLPGGSISSLTYASTVNEVFLNMFVTTMVTVLFPRLSRCVEAGNKEALRAYLSLEMRSVAFIIIPVMTFLEVFRLPIIELLFQRGDFDAYATQTTTVAFAFFVIGMLGMAWTEILNQAFYAQKDTKIPAIVSIGVATLSMILKFQLVGYLAHGGLALAYSIATGVGVCILILFWHQKIGGIDWWRLVRSLEKIIFAACGMASVSYLVFLIICGMHPWAAKMFPLAVSLAIAGISYIVLTSLLRCEEFLVVINLIGKVMNWFTSSRTRRGIL